MVDRFGMVKLNRFTLFASYPRSGLHLHGFGLHFASHSPVFVYSRPVLVDTVKVGQFSFEFYAVGLCHICLSLLYHIVGLYMIWAD